MSADSVPSSKTNIFQSKLYTLICCRHFRTYSRCAMFDWSDTVFRRRNMTRSRISNTALQPRYWGSEADSPEVCRLNSTVIFLPDVSDVWRWPNPVKTLNVHFLLQNPQWNHRMNSHEPCIITKGKIFNFLNGACGNFYGNLHWSLEKKENKTKYHAKIDIFFKTLSR